ncbi:hypothetical protein LSH36_50g05049 [Paralvinella palmiformis]|uniref:Bcl-2 Bcl-2 homology region 1-3 domain-containing protein n=1 Tax=Paralvinella palmiformis TaxID=53620 RepID=A0AAD9NCY7_9ANNE|nr:hypothetical protein LSH36_50g05049 [Paralvinella palmiformis]
MSRDTTNPFHFGPPLERISEVAHALKVIGDELDRDERFRSLVDGINITESRQTFYNVAMKLFGDGNFNWGRVVALFYFAYRLVVKESIEEYFGATAVQVVGIFLTGLLLSIVLVVLRR